MGKNLKIYVLLGALFLSACSLDVIERAQTSCDYLYKQINKVASSQDSTFVARVTGIREDFIHRETATFVDVEGKNGEPYRLVFVDAATWQTPSDTTLIKAFLEQKKCNCTDTDKSKLGYNLLCSCTLCDVELNSNGGVYW